MKQQKSEVENSKMHELNQENVWVLFCGKHNGMHHTGHTHTHTQTDSPTVADMMEELV